MTPNEGANNLHSGPDGFEKKMWTASEISEDKNAVTFSRISPDGENGFPGEFNVSVTYEMTEENELRIVYGGVCDQDNNSKYDKSFIFQPCRRRKRQCDGSVFNDSCRTVYTGW